MKSFADSMLIGITMDVLKTADGLLYSIKRRATVIGKEMAFVHPSCIVLDIHIVYIQVGVINKMYTYA